MIIFKEIFNCLKCAVSSIIPNSWKEYFGGNQNV